MASAALLAAAALLSPPAALAGEADTRLCVTVGEYRAVNPYMGGSAGTRAHIRAVFDTSGTVYRHSEYEAGGETQRTQWRKYDRCGSTRVYRTEYHKFGSRPYFSYWG